MDLFLSLAALSFSLKGNFLLYLIGGCSLIGFTIFIERVLYLHQSQVDTRKLLLSLRQIIGRGEIMEAIAHCEATKGAISSILRSGLLKYRRSKEEMEDAMQVAALVAIAEMEKHTKILSLLAHITPLIGLLGTVLGFMQAFSEMRISGLIDISTTRLGEAMEFALITTAAGLVVAIPSVIGYNYLVSRVERFVLEIKTAASEVIDLLLEYNEEHAC